MNFARKLTGLFAPAEWEYIPQGWEYAGTHPQVKGWNVPEILEVYKRKWPKFASMVKGVGPLGIAHESGLATNTDVSFHNTIMSFAYAVTLTAYGLDSLAILDWGGGIGHYCLLAESLLPDVKIEYTCKDVPALVDYGAQLFPNQSFYKDETCLQKKYDFVMAGNSLHYTKDWQGLLARLAQAGRKYLYIAYLPIVKQARDFVFLQRPYSYGYNTEYLAWCLNREEFLRHARADGLRLKREFFYGKLSICKAPEQIEFRGYLFDARQNTAETD